MLNDLEVELTPDSLPLSIADGSSQLDTGFEQAAECDRVRLATSFFRILLDVVDTRVTAMSIHLARDAFPELQDRLVRPGRPRSVQPSASASGVPC